MTHETLSDELIKRMKEKLDKDIRELISPSRKTQLVIFCISLFIAIISSLHGLNEAWAWEVAKALITINGLVLGFVILGATIFSKREVMQATHEIMIEESLDEIMKRAAEYKEKSKATFEEFLEKEFLPLLLKPTIQLQLFVGISMISVVTLLFSIGFAFCLFGVSDATVDIFPLQTLFLLIYAMAINFFIQGVYRITNGIFAFLGISTGHSPKEIFKLIAEGLEKRTKDFKNKKKRAAQSRHTY